MRHSGLLALVALVACSPPRQDLSLPGMDVVATIDSVRVRSTDGAEWTWRLSEVRTDDGAVELSNPRLVPIADGIGVDRGPVVEQYMRRPVAVQQQFRIDRPVGDGVTCVSGVVESTGAFEETAHGWSWTEGRGAITLGRATTFDRVGDVVPTSMAVHPTGTSICVDAVPADRYPLLIDPDIGVEVQLSLNGIPGDEVFSGNARVAFDAASDRYFAAYEGDAGVSLDREIFVQYLDASSLARLLASDLQISETGTPGVTSTRAENPEVALRTVDGSWGVVWGAKYTSTDEEIFGAVVDSTGVAGPQVQITETGLPTDSSTRAYGPSIAYNDLDDEFLVVYYADPVVDGHYEVYGQRLDPSFGLIGGPFQISTAGDPNDTWDSASQPHVVWSPARSEYMVVYQRRVNNEAFEIYGARLDGLGAPIAAGLRLTEVGTFDGIANTANAEHPRVATDEVAGEWRIVWEADDDAFGLPNSEYEVFYRRIAGDGTPLADALHVSASGPDGLLTTFSRSADVAVDPASGVTAVLWDSVTGLAPLAGNEREIYGRGIVGATGGMTAIDRLSQVGGDGTADPDSAFAPSIAWDASRQQFLVAFHASEQDPSASVFDKEVFGQLWEPAVAADSDGDGVTDLLDQCPGGDDNIDTDADGTADACDPCPLDATDDSDGDGVCDSADLCPGWTDQLDQDADGVPNACDPCPASALDDSDGDGSCDDADSCPGFDDSIDGDGDGVPDACDPCPADPTPDSDGDGVCDSIDACPGFDDTVDTDGDGAADGCDPCPADPADDSDGDAVCDSVDVCPGDDDLLDADGSGVPDCLEACGDGDSDGVCDELDTCPGHPDGVDTDSDGVPDGCDPCPLLSDDDTDGDGVCDALDICAAGDDTADSDADGVPDACDPCPVDAADDSDGDGVCDSADQCPGADDQADGDGDGQPDACDPCPVDPSDDTDGDGLCDSSDLCPLGDDTADVDGDGVADACDPCPLDSLDDTDGDGVCDGQDACPGSDDTLDADSDGLPDGCDACPADAAGDSDGDGTCDSVDRCPGSDDTLDADTDGVPDGCDPCPADTFDDSDGDGSCDSADACPGFDDSLDADGDGIPDPCDPCPADAPDDTDGDGSCDSQDLCPAFDDAQDADGDGVPDACDPCPLDSQDDTDGDGTCDGQDVCPGGEDFLDGDGDGQPDACDPCPIDPLDDSDGDGLCDHLDLCPGAPDGPDSDSDGIPDGCDSCPNDVNDDADGDGICDSQDLCYGTNSLGDADGDGICDSGSGGGKGGCSTGGRSPAGWWVVGTASLLILHRGSRSGCAGEKHR